MQAQAHHSFSLIFILRIFSLLSVPRGLLALGPLTLLSLTSLASLSNLTLALAFLQLYYESTKLQIRSSNFNFAKLGSWEIQLHRTQFTHPMCYYFSFFFSFFFINVKLYDIQILDSLSFNGNQITNYLCAFHNFFY